MDYLTEFKNIQEILIGSGFFFDKPDIFVDDSYVILNFFIWTS